MRGWGTSRKSIGVMQILELGAVSIDREMHNTKTSGSVRGDIDTVPHEREMELYGGGTDRQTDGRKKAR